MSDLPKRKAQNGNKDGGRFSFFSKRTLGEQLKCLFLFLIVIRSLERILPFRISAHSFLLLLMGNENQGDGVP
jgi:hypothetical protein